MDIEAFKFFLKQVCKRVNKNRHLNLEVIDVNFYGNSKYNNIPIYEITLTDGEKELKIYASEYSFNNGSQVPCSGRNFQPKDGKQGPDDQKLILAGAWCLCAYNYNAIPPLIRK